MPASDGFPLVNSDPRAVKIGNFASYDRGERRVKLPYRRRSLCLLGWYGQ
jgi:hypothetical protein